MKAPKKNQDKQTPTRTSIRAATGGAKRMIKRAFNRATKAKWPPSRTRLQPC